MATNTGPSIIVGKLLRKDNHENWRACMKNYLLSQDLWEVVEEEIEPPKAEEDEAGYKAWRRKNAAALHAIQISCSPDLLAEIREKSIAKEAWDTLTGLCEPTPPKPAQPVLAAAAEAWPVERTNLVKAIIGRDVNTVRRLLTEHPDLINAKIVRGETRCAIHFAILGELEIVDQFLSTVSKEDSEKKSNGGNTALNYAAMYEGKAKIAERLTRKNEELLTIPNNRNSIPLVSACLYGHADMIHYLYSVTPLEFLLSPENQRHANKVIFQSISNKSFDVAWDLLRRCPQLAVYSIGTNYNAIKELSLQTSAFLSTSGLSFWQRCVYSCLKVKRPDYSSDDIRIYIDEKDQQATKSFILKGKLLGLWSNFLTFFGIKQIYDLKLNHLYAHELLVLISKSIAGLNVSQLFTNGVCDAIFKATQLGMTEFITQIIKANMDLLWLADNKGRNIFEIAVANRQEKTFSLIYGLDFMKNEFITYVDKEGNTILHLAGQLSDYSKLAHISGVALQMQRELQWLKEVESIVPTGFKNCVNKSGKTAEELFNESHVDMIKEGEKWMKDIAKSSTIVGTLIITIMYQALYTVPGGNNQETGIPLLLTTKAFKVFVMSDGISLFASSTSVLTSFGILMSRYEAKDFLKSLPTKLIIVLSSLFISIATMMIAFCASAFLTVNGKLSMVAPINLLACIPVSLFTWFQFPLLVRMIISTYVPRIFDRKMKNWLK